MTPKRVLFSVTFYLVLLSTATDGFFLGSSYRKQPDCVRRAPHAASWVPAQMTPTSGSNVSAATTVGNSGSNNNQVNNGGQPGHGIYKDYGANQQQTQTTQSQLSQQAPLQQPQTQQPPPSPPPSKIYASQQQTVQTATKLDAANYQAYNQGQWPNDNGYGSYPQNVQLIPCLCPVNKDIIEQQQQQQNFQQHQPSTRYLAPTYFGDGGVSPQTNPKNNY